eukprot:TRINITY_DN7531_c0_g1_i1.p1 TRINITY_DN7531_c0_g1~~TRINITY_DN7531_c0_g1_i1.p1  ORF type:complete len:438 (+),score=91.27 TRINITY_DN7531_c0_g1_i1:82-1395(+)
MEQPTHLPFAPPGKHTHSNSTIDKSHILECLIKLMPAEQQDSVQSMQQMRSFDTKQLIEMECDLSEVQLSEESKQTECKKSLEEEKIEAGCCLWDLTLLPEQSTFLHEHHIIPLLIYNLNRFVPPLPSSRLCEICLGILANMASVEAINQELCKRKDLDSTMNYYLFHSKDPALLTELMRLLTVGVSMESTKQYWIHFTSKDKILRQILSIFRNTLNENLMERTSSLLHYVLYTSHQVLFKLIDFSLIPAIIEVLTHDGVIGFHLSAHIADLVLRLLEVCSLQSHYYKYLEENSEVAKNLVQCICKTIMDYESSSVISTATVVLANMGLEDPQLIQQFIQSRMVLKTLMDQIPTEDEELQAGLWQLLRIASLPTENNPHQQNTILVLTSHVDKLSEESRRVPSEMKSLCATVLDQIQAMEAHHMEMPDNRDHTSVPH